MCTILRAVAVSGILGCGTASAQSESQLQYVCKDFVERLLHDPRDAELNWTKGTVSKTKKPEIYVVRFSGRARNGFGALRRMTFQCIVRYKGGDNFSAVDVSAKE